MATNTSGHGAFASDIGRIYWTYALCLGALAVLLAILEQVGVAERTLGYLVVFFTVGTYATIGVLARTMQVGEFYVAGRRIPALYNGMAAAADWIGGAVFIGLAGSLYVLGADGLAFVLGLVGGFVLVAVLIAPQLRKFGAYTVPDFLATRYQSPVVRAFSVLVVIACSFAFLGAQIYATGVIAARFLGIDLNTGMVAALTALLASSVLGGMRSVTWTQVAQYLVMVVAFLVPAIVLAAVLYDLPAPQIVYGQALGEIAALENRLISEGFADHGQIAPHLAAFATLGAPNFIALVICLAIGAASFPHLLMHFAATPSVRETRRSVGWAMVFVVVLLITAPAYAAFAKLAIYQNAIGANLSALPEWIAAYSRQGLIAVYGLTAEVIAWHVETVKVAIAGGASEVGAVAATLSGEAARAWTGLDAPVQAAVFNAVSENPTVAPAEVWQRAIWAAAIGSGNTDGLLHLDGFAIDPAAILIVAPGVAGLPAVAGGIVAAGALAATLSTGNGLLVAIANTLSHDVYYRSLDPLASTAQRLVVARLLMIAIAIAAAWLAINRSADVLRVVAWSFSLAAAGNFPVLVMSIWWKRTTEAGAVAGIVAGLGATVGYIAVTGYWPAFAIAELGMEPVDPAVQRAVVDLLAGAGAAAPAVGWFGISNVAAGLIGVPIGMLVTLAVSLVGRRPSPAAEAFVDDIRTPRGRSYMEKERAAERAREFGRGD